MKKFKIAFIMFLVAAGFIYANDRLSVELDWVVDSVYIRRFLGYYTVREETRAHNPYRFQGDGMTKFFQTSMFREGIQGRIALAYTGERIGGSFALRMAEDFAFNDIAEWSAWFRFRPNNDSFNIRLLAGNNEQKGRLGNFGIMFPVWRTQGNYVPNNFFASTIDFPFGYFSANMEMGFVEFYMTETSDVFMPAGSHIRKPLNFLADFNFRPLSVTLATGGLFAQDSIPLTNIFNDARGEDVRGILYDAIYNPATIGAMNFAVRVESAQIADLVTIGATYKLTSSIFSKIFPSDATFPLNPTNIIDENKTNHAFGLFTVFNPLNTLAISAGYSGLYQTWRNPKHEHTFISIADIIEHEWSAFSEAIHPIFHGIDINLTYIGFERLTLSLNNNVTFARVRGINRSQFDAGMFSLGWAYREHLGNQTGEGEGRSERYLGFANQLALLFALNENINISASITNHIGFFTLFGGTASENPTSSSHYLNIRTGIGYTLFDRSGVTGEVFGGFYMRIARFAYQDAVSMEKFRAGLVEIALPFRFSLRF